MSKLKAHTIIGLDGRCNRVDDYYYLKSEADKVIDKKDAEIRRLKRALYKACANWAFLAQWESGELVENWEKWENVERKCRAKVEEY